MRDNLSTSLPAAIRIGVSMCLLGEPVRYDGGHKHERFLTGTFGRYFEWVPVCPEVELGMGTPREPIQLVQLAGGIQLVGVKSRRDHTAAMQDYARRRVDELATLGLAGYIFKQGSPSCGTSRVRVHRVGGRVTYSGRGMFAAMLMDRMPNLPVLDETGLADPSRRENWIERVVAYHRLSGLRSRRSEFAAFHPTYRLVLWAHAPRAYDELGSRLAAVQSSGRAGWRVEYEREFMSALAVPATRSRHARVLRSVVRSLSPHLDDTARLALFGHIGDYEAGRIPLSVPLAVAMHYARLCDVAELRGQWYLNPHPAELALRQG
jgi:uncharacterized protein YbbK (DUF523 family)/uncharacterized protein YbgA (DUF1722 family)